MDVPAGVAINAYRAGLHPSFPLKVSTSGGSHEYKLQPDAIALKDQLESCLKLLRSLIDAMVRSTKDSSFAGSYFHPLIRQLDNELVRIEIWTFDVGAYEPDFGRSAQVAVLQLELTRYITTILKGLRSQLEEIAKQVEEMRSLIAKLSGSRLNDLKLDRQLRTMLTQLEKEYQKVALAIRSIVSLTEAFQMEQAVKLLSGPFAGIRQQSMVWNSDPGNSTQSPGISTEEPVTGSIGVAASEELGPWGRKTLLSIDGGGTHNISSILIIQALMAEIAVQEQTILPQASSSASPLPLEPPKVLRRIRWRTSQQPQSKQPQSEQPQYLPCHYFDYIIGTGFGGLIAIMLSRLRMNVENCLSDFQALLHDVWSQSRIFGLRAPTFWPRDKYSYRTLEHELMVMVNLRSPNGNKNATFGQRNEDTCRCIVTSFQSSDEPTANGVHLFHSYHHPNSPINDPTSSVVQHKSDHSMRYTIWEIARAATAAPTFFAPMKLAEGTEVNLYIDGGFGAANPSLEGYKSVREASGREPRVVVSVGSGASRQREIQKTVIFGYTDLVNFPRRLGANAEKVHNALMKFELERSLDYYARLNVEEGLGDIKLDEWRGKRGRDTLSLIHEKTNEYLHLDSVRKSITETARALVETRRARASDPDLDQWERFCHGVEYVCPLVMCDDRGNIHRKRRELRRHLEDVHHTDSSEIETVLDQGKRFPLYDVNSKDE